MEPVLQLAEVSIRFGTAEPVVRSMDFSIAAGQTLALVGESGSGKSLTALAIMGLLPKGADASGTITLQVPSGKVSLLRLDRHDWQLVRGSAAGLVFQEPMSALNPLMTIGYQLTEAIRQHQTVSGTSARQQAIVWLQKVQLPTPEKLYDRYPHQLSGGQKQRVIIAMALCNRPALVIADEPTTALDATVQLEIVRLLQTLQQETGTALLFITHDLALAHEIADELLVLYRGETMEYGPAESLFRNPQHPYTKALLQCRPDATAKGTRLPQVSDFLNGRPEPDISSLPLPVLSEITPEVLQVKELSVVYGSGKNAFRAVDDVSFTLRQGEVLGLVGESGCGKSTVAKALMGLVPIHHGTVTLTGEGTVSRPQGPKALRRQMQLVFQDPAASLNPRMTVLDAIAEPMIAHRLYGAREARVEAARLLEQVGVSAASGTKYPHEFSGGQKQRVGIARALSLRPKILICDESVSALDVSIQAQILNLLQDLRMELKLSYLFISHDLQVVHYLADRVLVMQAGRVVESGWADAVLRHPEHPYTQKLVVASKW
jgi:peptide/nickel transport system ATP-binding protein